MAIQGQKISEMTALDAIKGTEYIPVVDGNTNKKMVISKLAKKEDIPNVSGFITSSQADGKYATLAQIGDIETILDNIIGG